MGSQEAGKLEAYTKGEAWPHAWRAALQYRGSEVSTSVSTGPGSSTATCGTAWEVPSTTLSFHLFIFPGQRSDCFAQGTRGIQNYTDLYRFTAHLLLALLLLLLLRMS